MKKNLLTLSEKTRFWISLLVLTLFCFNAGAAVWPIPADEADTLEHFIENTDLWSPGDTIMLVSEGEYIVNGTVDIYQEVTIMGDPDLDTAPLLIMLDNGFRAKEDSISITLMNLEMDGYDEVEDKYAPYVLRFDQAAFYNYHNIVVENVTAYNFQGGLQLYKNQWTRYDTVIINDVVWHDFSGQYAIDPRNNAASYMASTNSTFYNIETGFLKNPYWCNTDKGCTDTIPQEIVVDHNTFYNVAGGGNNSLLQINDPSDLSIDLKFTNNIVSKLWWPEYARPFRINEDAGDIMITNCTFHDFLATDAAKLKYNLDSVALYANVTVGDILEDYPGFADTAGYDFSLSYPDAQLLAGTEGDAIGDPRWGTADLVPNVHMIPNTAEDTLEHFIENKGWWHPGDIIKLVSEGEYIVNGTVDIYQEVTITGDPDLASAPVLIMLDNGFRAKEDSISITLMNMEMDGYDEVEDKYAPYILRMDQSAYKNYHNIVIENVAAYNFQGGLQLYKNQWTRYDTVIINNVIWHDISGQYAIDPRNNAASYMAITNSTFYNIETGFMKNPYWCNTDKGCTDTIPQEIVVDHNTFYNVAGGGNNSLLQINDPSDLSIDLKFTNNIVSMLFWPEYARPFRINEDAGDIMITNCTFHDFLATDAAKLKYNLDSVALYANVTVSDILEDYPGFTDTVGYNFSISYPNAQLLAGSDGGAIGDPRWGTSMDVPTVHLIPNTAEDTLEHFVENKTWWRPGDTIMLVSEGDYIVNGTVDIYKEVTIMGDPALETLPVLTMLDNGFRAKEDSISITLMNLEMDGYDEVEDKYAPYILRFDQAAFKNYHNIVIDNVVAYNFQGGLQLYKNQWTRYDTVIINDVVWHDISGQYAVDPRNNAASYMAITNSTFYNIETGFLKNPYWCNTDKGCTDTIPQEIIVDHNTFYNVAGGGNNSLLQVNDPADGSVNLVFRNNIVSMLFWPEYARPFRINEDAGDILITNSIIHDFLATDAAKLKYNLDSVALYANVTVTDVWDDYPGFADTVTYDFALSYPSWMLTAATDEHALGDPRWGEVEWTSVHRIPNTAEDTLEHFVENTQWWRSGDTIMLVSEGEYIVNGTVDIYKEVTIMGDPELETLPILVMLDNGFRPKEDSISITLMNMEMDGYDEVEDKYAPYILRMDQASFYNYHNIVIENVVAYNFQGGLQLYKNQWTRYDTVIINNVIWHDISGQYAIDPRNNAASYMAITNSTFYNVETGFLKNPYWCNTDKGCTDTIPQEIIVDHNTFWKVAGGGNNSMLQVNDPADGSVDLKFTNNIVSKLFWPQYARPFRINEGAGDIRISHSTIHDFEAADTAKWKYNLDSVALYPNVTVAFIHEDYPEFKDTVAYDFSLDKSSPLLIASTNNEAIGDPRWAPEIYRPTENVHPIPNTSPDTLEHFIENIVYWKPGDTILLVSSGEYIVNGTVDIYQEITVMGDPELTVPPTLVCLDNGFRAKEDSISITLKNFKMDGYDEVEDKHAPYVLRMDQAAFKNYHNIVIENVEAFNFQGGLQLYKNQWTRYDTVIINNVIWHDISGQYAIDPRNNAVSYMSVTNSTFYKIETGFMKNPYFCNTDKGCTDTIPQQIIIDHNTFWKVAGGGNNSLLQVNDPSDGSVDLMFSNNIVSKLFWPQYSRPFRINEDAGDFIITHSTFHDFLATDAAKLKYNLDSVAGYANVAVGSIYGFYPGFRDTTDGDFMLPDSSSLLFAGTDMDAIGDPRWVPQVGVTIRDLTEAVTETDTVQLLVDVVLSEGADTTVTWTVVDGYSGTEGAADIDAATGRMIATADGKVLVIVTSNENPLFADTLVLTIEAINWVESITLVAKDFDGNETTEITNKGGFLTVIATILPGNADDKSITWSVSGEGKASITPKTSVSADLVAISSGTVTVRATAGDGSGVYGEIDIEISGQTPVTAVTVTSETGDTAITTDGGTLQMVATVEPDTADIKVVTWSVSDTNIAVIDSTGILTARSNGTVTVTARATDGTYKSGTMVITISGQNVGIGDAPARVPGIYPNPAGDFIYIRTASQLQSDIVITDLTGAVVKTARVDPDATLDIRDLDQGVYIVTVKAGDQLSVVRLIKQ